MPDTVTILSIAIAENKQSEDLRMALTEVTRQVAAGKTEGLVHGLPWKLKTGADLDGNITEANPFTGGYMAGTCDVNLVGGGVMAC